MPNDLTDINNFSGRLQTQFELIEEIDAAADRQALRRWGQTQDVADTTLIDRLKNIRLLALRSDQRLVDMDKADVLSQLAAFAQGSHPDVPDDGLAGGTIRQYRQAVRLFFRDELDREWAEDITIGQAERTPIGPDQILTGDEVDALLEHSDDARDTALFAVLCVTGQRITAALSIRMGDVDLDDRVGTIRLNDDAKGLKGASGPRPVLWARPYIASWLNQHPCPHDADAPLFCATQSGERPREDGDVVTWAVGDPMSRSQAATRLRAVAERAGVDTAKVKPHNFRHTAITRMRDQGVPDDRIKFMVGVDPESDILERYDKATNEKMLERIRSDHGMDVDDDLVVGRPSLEQCPQCGSPLRGSARFCPQCGMPLDSEAADTIEDGKENLEDTMVEALPDADSDTIEKVLQVKRLLDDPSVRELLDEGH